MNQRDALQASIFVTAENLETQVSKIESLVGTSQELRKEYESEIVERI